MKLRAAELSDEQQHILDQLSAWSGVLDFGFFGTFGGLDATEDDHREAVKLTMSRLRSELEATNDRTSVERGIDRSKFFTIRFEEASVSALVPKQISWQQFLGTRYDFRRQGLLVRGDQKYYNNLFWFFRRICG